MNRQIEVDFIRMAALIGICVVNVPFMALPTEQLFALPANRWDISASLFTEVFFQLKFFLLFSFIFGWGMAIQQLAAASKGEHFKSRYFRRIMGLAIFGVLNATLVFSGDILVLYAILGSLLWLMEDHEPRALLKRAAWMIPVSMACLILLAVLMEESTTQMPLGSEIFSLPSLGGSFVDATQARLADWPETFLVLLLLQGPLAFAAFLVGLAAAKSDFFAPNSPYFKSLTRRAPWLLLLALALNVWYSLASAGLLPQNATMLNFVGFILISVGAPLLSAVYLVTFILLARRWSAPYLLVLSGKNTLSTYILQGVISGWVFGGYGLGLFGDLDQAALLGLALLISLISMTCVGIYTHYMGRGPLEQVLRLISH
ncbi:hypothetical protein GCM10009007_12670 [Formosimonas limnophila]|uniref:DUF418 domain-containing protein n=1 Tax=Formosimonas limnophila TaxID=1384487 RepID=A0A8J3CHQ2_9BURK|nr:DUF418 domain-containing protein [Formosimonas limnophila]GHA73240.1 hypothetical protein GCM10009007_12670 [Formosimonas limnophila]